jgi:tRNA nucleotidyltransferase/poly(A) polymerase
LGRTPKDYDVATSARPEQVRELFGHRRTLALGAAFGVIAVRGPQDAGQIEVATFRRDDAYSDGRRPDHVTFSSAAEDAARRDFTINGIFYDPLDERVLDFVGGQEDLRRRLIRAIGDPRERFEEDKLRLLRAVRFAATFEFDVEPRTLEAVCLMAGEITVVSAERIAGEMERMLVDRHRVRAVRLLVETGLAAGVLPEIVPASPAGRDRLDAVLAVLDRLAQPGFPLALATLLHLGTDAAAAAGVCRRWRLSNRQTERTAWLVEHHAALREPRSLRWSQLQPLLVAEGIDDLISLEEAAALAARRDTSHLAWCRSLLAQPSEVLDPPPLLTGDDLLRHGVRPGPVYRVLLQRIREAQLDGEIRTPDDALALADRLWRDDEG